MARRHVNYYDIIRPEIKGRITGADVVGWSDGCTLILAGLSPIPLYPYKSVIARSMEYACESVQNQYKQFYKLHGLNLSSTGLVTTGLILFKLSEKLNHFMGWTRT